MLNSDRPAIHNCLSIFPITSAQHTFKSFPTLLYRLGTAVENFVKRMCCMSHTYIYGVLNYHICIYLLCFDPISVVLHVDIGCLALQDLE